MCLCSESWTSFNVNLIIAIIIILMFFSSMKKMFLVKFQQKRHSQVIFHLEFTGSVTCSKKTFEFKVKHSKKSFIGEKGDQ